MRHCHRYALQTLLLASLLCPTPARAELTPSVFVGMLEAIGTEGEAHLGVYATMGFGLAIPLGQSQFSLVPQIGFEMAPEFGNWGATFFLTLDRVIHENKLFALALDPYFGLVHDALPIGDGNFDHFVYLGGGIGPTFIFGRTALAPSLGVYADVDSGAVVLNPTLLFIVNI